MSRIKPLLRGVFASIADQAAFSGTNFAVNVLLARWLTSEGYGAFSVAWSMYLILFALHNALIVEPMTVVGPGEFGTRLGQLSQTGYSVELDRGVRAGPGRGRLLPSFTEARRYGTRWPR